MMDTFHPYAAERLAAAADAEAIRIQHFGYYVGLAERHGTERALWEPDAAEHLARMDAEINNLHAALGWAVRQPSAEHALAMGAALGTYWVMRNRYGDAVDWVDRALNLPGAHADPALRVRALGTKTRCLWQMGRRDEEPAVVAEVEAIARRLGDPLILSRALRLRVGYEIDAERLDVADAVADEALRWARAADDEWEIALVSRRKAIAASNIDQLRERVARAASLLTDVGNVYQLANLLSDAAYAALCLGSARDARDFAARAAPITRALDSPFVRMINSGNLGLAELLIGEADAASRPRRSGTAAGGYARGVTLQPVEIPVAGATLRGDRWVGEGPAVVLLHAGVCDRRCWHEVGERLAAAGCDVVAYDRRGFGQVPAADGPFRHVDDLLAVVDAVSPNTPVRLVGSSMGGGVALDAALEAAERVAGLVLLAPTVGGDPEPDDAAVLAATNGLAGAIDAAWTAGDLEECNRLEVRLWLDGPAGPEGRVSGPARELALDMNRIVLANGESDADGASGIDAASRLDEIGIPAIVACGELDVPTKVRRSAELADSLPNGTYRALPGRAHLPYLEDAAEVAALIPREPL